MERGISILCGGIILGINSSILIPYQLKLKLKNYKILEYECAKVFTLRVIAFTLFIYLTVIGDVYLKINYGINDWFILIVFVTVCHYANNQTNRFMKFLEKKNSIVSPNKYLSNDKSHPSNKKDNNNAGKSFIIIF